MIQTYKHETTPQEVDCYYCVHYSRYSHRCLFHEIEINDLETDVCIDYKPIKEVKPTWRVQI